MSVELFLKNVPSVVKELIAREAFENRRSVNQEAIALLEEALLQRVGGPAARPRTTLESLLHAAHNKGAAVDQALPKPADGHRPEPH